jgi:phosphoribosylglycinamide formyltransferase 1
VHIADNEYDHGPIILQRAVAVLEDDDANALARRVFESEKEALPEALQLYADGKLEILEGRRVRVATTVQTALKDSS